MRSRTWVLSRNYLRVRGEYASPRSVTVVAVELPPRARRILTIGIKRLDTHGTTSACAENTADHRR